MSSFYIIFYLPAVISLRFSLFLRDFTHLDSHEFALKLWIHHEPQGSPSSDPFCEAEGCHIRSQPTQAFKRKACFKEVKISHSLCTMEHHVVYLHYQSTTSIIHNLDVYGPNVMFSFLVPEFQKTASLLRGLELLLYVELSMAN